MKYALATVVMMAVCFAACSPARQMASNQAEAFTPVAVATAAAAPATAVPTAEASPTVVPLATALPTATPAPTTTPSPTITPVPTVPPTATPVPPSLTPEPEASQYVFPVRAAEYTYGQFHHDYPATDIFCSIGSEFVAPTSGVIDFVSREDMWDAATNNPEDRGGLSIAMIGDDGWRYYGSHLSEIARGIEAGKRVEVGQVLGLTGKSGNASATPPHLHFGISHPTTPDDWQVRRGELSPYPLLKAWEKNQNKTPGA